MTKTVRRRALQAAARVAMVTTLLGAAACDGGESEDTTGPAGEVADTETHCADSTDPGDASCTVADTGGADTGDGGDTGSVDPETCEELVASDFLNGTVDDETASCCQDIAEAFDVVGLKGMESWGERGECCDLLGWHKSGTMACTPWGPPAPPAMPGEVA